MRVTVAWSPAPRQVREWSLDLPEGATVERGVPMAMSHNGTLQLDLQSNDFATARAVADAVLDGTAPRRVPVSVCLLRDITISSEFVLEA